MLDTLLQLIKLSWDLVLKYGDVDNKRFDWIDHLIQFAYAVFLIIWFFIYCYMTFYFIRMVESYTLNIFELQS